MINNLSSKQLINWRNVFRISFFTFILFFYLVFSTRAQSYYVQLRASTKLAGSSKEILFSKLGNFVIMKEPDNLLHYRIQVSSRSEAEALRNRAWASGISDAFIVTKNGQPTGVSPDAENAEQKKMQEEIAKIKQEKEASAQENSKLSDDLKNCSRNDKNNKAAIAEKDSIISANQLELSRYQKHWLFGKLYKKVK